MCVCCAMLCSNKHHGHTCSAMFHVIILICASLYTLDLSSYSCHCVYNMLLMNNDQYNAKKTHYFKIFSKWLNLIVQEVYVWLKLDACGRILIHECMGFKVHCS